MMIVYRRNFKSDLNTFESNCEITVIKQYSISSVLYSLLYT